MSRGKFQIDRPLVSGGGIQHAIDFAERFVRVVQLGAGDADFLEHVGLRVKIAHLVVQQRIVDSLAQARVRR